MQDIASALVLAGFAAIATAIFGGGFTAMGWKFPILQNAKRQVMAGLVGLAFLVGGITIAFNGGISGSKSGKIEARTTGNCSPAFSGSTVGKVDVHC